MYPTSIDNFDDHSNLYYDDDVVNDHMPYNELQSHENIYLKNDNIILNKKLKELSSNAKNEITKNKLKIACHYCGKNENISHTCPRKKI